MMRTQGLRSGAYYYRPIERYDFKLCEWGIKKLCSYGGDHPEEEIRPPLVFPNILRIPTEMDETLHWRVPIDDTHTNIIMLALRPSPNGERVEQPGDPPVLYLDAGIGPDGEIGRASCRA